MLVASAVRLVCIPSKFPLNRRLYNYLKQGLNFAVFNNFSSVKHVWCCDFSPIDNSPWSAEFTDVQ